MRSATNDLRRLGSAQAGAGGSRGLEKLKDLERRLRGPGDNAERRRKAGDLQLEARQLADDERQLASELLSPSTSSNTLGPDVMRRLAGEQQRLGDRARRLQNDVKQPAAGRSAQEPPRLAERMQQSAEALQRAA